ncbi:von Willebrand factor D and EGF domain-containing protein [Thelohanellus kitauei]|uniref:von Willebrand factor D and EGF domain-containing protein n=1 Tax=Thelohanellus kitauei TaxID=669202 RepID=A0A0C2M8P4_THEKT|nr:von Willebrand factor D and EGF domain-containing protein [Thelohanellus kitauei]
MEYICNCTEGYYGDRCQFKHRCAHCMPGMCVDGSRCSQCRPGWEGESCANKSCKNYTLCQNNSTCHTNATNRECVCPNNFYGEYCQFTRPITPSIFKNLFTGPTTLGSTKQDLKTSTTMKETTQSMTAHISTTSMMEITTSTPLLSTTSAIENSTESEIAKPFSTSL